MDIGSVLLGLALLVGVLFYMAQPLLERRAAADRPASRADQLLHERESILTALRDLDFDHATGKITGADHAGQRAALLADGAQTLKQLDALGLRSRAPAAEDDLERAIARRRKKAPAAAGYACPHCSAPLARGDLFCAGCGASIPHCEQCGVPHKAGDRFCAGCGQPLPEAAAA